jgi:hypothetical protein
MIRDRIKDGAGMPASAVDDMAAKLQAEQKAIEACQLECTKLVESMRELLPAPAAKIKAQLDELLNSQPKISADFKRETLAMARVHECAANTRAVDACLNDAIAKAKANDLDARNRLVGAANAFARKASLLGADAKFQSAVDRRIEIIMMTGSGKFAVKKPEPEQPAAPTPPASSAKPAPGAPAKPGSEAAKPAATKPPVVATAAGAAPKPPAARPPNAAGTTPKPQPQPQPVTPAHGGSAAPKPHVAPPPNPAGANPSPKPPAATPPNPAGAAPKPPQPAPPSRPVAATPKPAAPVPQAAKH